MPNDTDGMQPASGHQRLYGLPGAEVMYFDPAEVYESEIEPWAGDDVERWCIQEWTVREPVTHEPNAERILDFITEWVSDNEVDEHCFDAWCAAARHPDVIAATEHLRSVLASKITFRMADSEVAQHWVTFDADGEPLYDGTPMYRPKAESHG